MKIDILKLDDLQRKYGYSNNKLSELSGISANTIAKARNGHSVYLVTIKRIARVFDIEPEALITREK